MYSPFEFHPFNKFILYYIFFILKYNIIFLSSIIILLYILTKVNEVNENKNKKVSSNMLTFVVKYGTMKKNKSVF